jgi:glutathione S-transferase
MQLIGRTMSPFVRRVAATLNLYGYAYENLPFATATQGAEIARFNPVGRVPALVTDAGESIVDSAAIIDWLDHQVGADRALTPLAGPDRFAVTKCLALALGAVEKAVLATYEKDRRPADKVWPEQVDKLLGQARGGFEALEAQLTGEWLVLGRMTQADVTTGIALDSAEMFNKPAYEGRLPKLKALRDRLNAIPAIGSTGFKG